MNSERYTKSYAYIILEVQYFSAPCLDSRVGLEGPCYYLYLNSSLDAVEVVLELEETTASC
jgi:hypothetical protein